MALIIEDGSQVVDANSYVTDAEYTAYATLKGLTVGANAVKREVELLRAMDYLQGLEQSFKGTRVSSSQSVSFPRYNVSLYGYLLASDKIPKELKNGQFEAAAYSHTGTLTPNETIKNVSKEKLGDLEVEYFKGGQSSRVIVKRANVYLQPLLNSGDALVRT
tara:strand:- start:1052 stop:1537 length:486 start_codon:yes stop_codon:yes gene_type:complete